MQTRTVISKARLRLRDSLNQTRRYFASPVQRSESANVFHCCLHKTGSQWVKRVLGDPDVFRRTGLKTYEYQATMPDSHDPRPVDQRSFDQPFPEKTIISPLYVDYGNYREIPKPDSSRAFFVTRDPRDLVTSWYFSQRYSHGLMGNMGEVRGTLDQLPESEGLIYSIRHLDDFGLYRAQRSWVSSADDPTVMVVRFEDLIGDQSLDHYSAMFSHCRLDVDDDTLAGVLDRYSFEKLSGRAQGTEDIMTHFRKGVAGDWRNHFDDAVRAEFNRVTGDLIEALGYELD